MPNFILIAFLGTVGVLSRYAVDQLLGDWNEKFPITTFSINVLGCFFAGCIYVLGQYRDFSSAFQTALLVGFCGGFTTFSAYALQAMALFERGKVAIALTYFLISPLLGLMAAFLPVLVARKVLG